MDAFTGERFQYVFALFIAYGYSVLPMMYLASFLFETPSVAYTRLTMFNIVFGWFITDANIFPSPHFTAGLAAMLTVNVLTILSVSGINTVKNVFLFLPNYCFGQGLSDLYNNYQTLVIAQQYCKAPLTLQECCDDLNALGFGELCEKSTSFFFHFKLLFCRRCLPEQLHGVGSARVCFGSDMATS